MENMTPEPITVKRQRSGQVSMALPRTDSGDVMEASGMRPATSAAHFADAQAKVLCGPAKPGRATTRGGK